jgi:hypothetical protein
MSKKKKHAKGGIKEAQKAQSTVRSMMSPVRVNNEAVIQASVPTNNLKNTFTLPINEIKRDLVKNAMFSVFSVVLLIVLSYTKIGYAQLAALLNF